MPESTLPTKMRAWTFSTNGAPGQILSLNSAYPVPASPKGSNLLVQVSYVNLTSAGVNLMREVPSILRRAAIPEMDFSGHVVLAGPTANPALPPGTRVFGTISPGSSVLSGAGSLAEYVVVPSELVQAIPQNIRLEEAATFGGLAQTALKMVETAGAAKGHRTIIHGASGGVGIVATQLAKAKGATVIATCSASKFDMVKAAGADEVVDYKAHGKLDAYLESTFKVQPFDSIMDAVGSQDLYVHSPAYLKPKGIYVNVGSLGDKSSIHSILRWAKNANVPNILGGTPRKFAMFGASVTPDGVRKLAEHARSGHLKVFIDSTFKMEDVLAGYDRLASREVKGRVMIEVRAPEDGDRV